MKEKRVPQMKTAVRRGKGSAQKEGATVTRGVSSKVGLNFRVASRRKRTLGKKEGYSRKNQGSRGKVVKLPGDGSSVTGKKARKRATVAPHKKWMISPISKPLKRLEGNLRVSGALKLGNAGRSQDKGTRPV